MASMHGGKLVAKGLKRHGVTHLFTLCGGHIQAIYDGCLDENIRVVESFIDNSKDTFQIEDDIYGNIMVAVTEAVNNAIRHGNKFDAGKLIRITAEVSKQEAKFTIEDEGEGFDVKNIPDPLDPANLVKTSGRGVLFIYNIMDEVKYNARGNRLTMIKKSEKVETTD